MKITHKSERSPSKVGVLACLVKETKHAKKSQDLLLS